MRLLTILFLALSGAGGAAAGENPPAAGKSDIIVIGEANREQREQQVRAFVRDLTDTRGTNPIARFDREAVCPAAVGLTAGQDDAVTARMRRVAAAAQIRLAVPGCRPNALVIFARDKRETVEALQREHPAYFLGRPGDDSRPAELAKRPGPVVAWYIQDIVDRNGVPVPVDRELGYRMLSEVNTPSRINPTTRPVIVAAVVVIEYRALGGLTTTQVGDYAAMRAFTRADPARLDQPGVATILTILDAPMGSAIPLTLTHWDLSYLRGYNAISTDRFAPQQRAEIGRQMIHDIERTAPPEK